ncbi:MAG: hypothetical protein ACK56N_00770 [Betaproteobacteria bacterium]
MAISASVSATPSTSPSQVAGLGGFPLRETKFGEVAFVPAAGFLPAAAGAAGTGAAATAGAAGTAASAPVLAAIAGGVLVVAAGAWVVTPEPQRAALLKQTLATARGMLQATGLAPEQINGHLRQIDRAFRQGKRAVEALVNQWRNGETASPPQAPARSRVQSTGGALRRQPARSSPQQPNGPQRPAASAPPLRPSAPPLSAADRWTLQGLHTQVEALQAQAGRVLTPAQLANGSLLRQLAQIEKSAAGLLRHPGAQAHRAELTALQTQARQAVAGLYRFTVNKAVAGLLTTASESGRQVRAHAAGAAPHAAQAYPPQALQQLSTQARPLLTTGADSPLLAGLQQWLAQRQAPAPVLDTPGRAPSGQPAPALPVPPGQRSTITYTNTAGGAVTGDPARALEKKAAQERAENVRRAADWVYNRQKSGATMAPADLAEQAAKLFGVRADEVLSALANRGNGPQGAQGGVRSSAGQGMGGGANVALTRGEFATALAAGELPDDTIFKDNSTGIFVQVKGTRAYFPGTSSEFNFKDYIDILFRTHLHENISLSPVGLTQFKQEFPKRNPVNGSDLRDAFPPGKTLAQAHDARLNRHNLQPSNLTTHDLAHLIAPKAEGVADLTRSQENLMDVLGDLVAIHLMDVRQVSSFAVFKAAYDVFCTISRFNGNDISRSFSYHAHSRAPLQSYFLDIKNPNSANWDKAVEAYIDERIIGNGFHLGNTQAAARAVTELFDDYKRDVSSHGYSAERAEKLSNKIAAYVESTHVTLDETALKEYYADFFARLTDLGQKLGWDNQGGSIDLSDYLNQPIN